MICFGVSEQTPWLALSVAACVIGTTTVAGLHCFSQQTRVKGQQSNASHTQRGRRRTTACFPGVQLASHKGNASTKVEQPPDSASAIAPPQQDTKPTTVPGMFASGPSSSLPIGSLTMPFGGSLLPTTAAPGPPEGLGSVINALSLCTSPQKVQGFLADLQARGNCQQVCRPALRSLIAKACIAFSPSQEQLLSMLAGLLVGKDCRLRLSRVLRTSYANALPSLST